VEVLALMTPVTHQTHFRGMILESAKERQMPAPDSRRAGKP